VLVLLTIDNGTDGALNKNGSKAAIQNYFKKKQKSDGKLIKLCAIIG